MKNLKLVKVANVRKHMDAHFRDEISYTEAVNRINEDANKALNIANVSHQRELLKAFLDWQRNKTPMPYDADIDSQIEEFEAFNCG